MTGRVLVLRPPCAGGLLHLPGAWPDRAACGRAVLDTWARDTATRDDRRICRQCTRGKP